MPYSYGLVFVVILSLGSFSPGSSAYASPHATPGGGGAGGAGAGDGKYNEKLAPNFATLQSDFKKANDVYDQGNRDYGNATSEEGKSQALAKIHSVYPVVFGALEKGRCFVNPDVKSYFSEQNFSASIYKRDALFYRLNDPEQMHPVRDETFHNEGKISLFEAERFGVIRGAEYRGDVASELSRKFNIPGVGKDHPVTINYTPRLSVDKKSYIIQATGQSEDPKVSWNGETVLYYCVYNPDLLK